MIVEDFLVINERGLYCRYGDFYLDPKEPSAYAVVSHAHGDHAVRGNDIVYCTPATAAIMKHRYQKNAGNTFLTYNWSETFDLNGVFIKEWGSINEVKRELNFNSFGIIKCCKKEKKYKTAYGFKWEYKNA